MKTTSAVDDMIQSISEENDIDIKSATEIYLKESESVIDMENLPIVKHNWVQRGIKVSCEGAGHPHHSHFLVKR